MREALGQPLSDVSSTILNKMVSKEVQMDLRKFKNGPSKIPSKRSKSNGGDNSPNRGRSNDTKV